jgi:uncharacterized membrane protein (UPF0127 family)
MAAHPHLHNPRAIIAIGVASLVVLAGVYVLFASPGQVELASIPSHFTVGGRTFGITYVALNESEWKSGLMNRKITDATTMLFIFPKSDIYPFWMYDTNSSLDIIWLSVNGDVGKVVYMVANAPSCYLPVGCPTYTPSTAANYVIEAKAGFAADNGVAIGSVVEFG